MVVNGFSRQKRPNGSIEQHKAKLVAKGFHERLGIDFDDIFNPIVKPTTIRLLFSIVVPHGLIVNQLDISKVFLLVNLDEHVDMV